MKKKIFKKALAFTLAEVLITLSILGVVAAITVPSLIKRQHRNDVAARLAKTVSALHDVLSRAEIESGKSYVAKSSELKTNFDFLNYISPYLNLSKDCTKTTTGCSTWCLNNNNGEKCMTYTQYKPSTTPGQDYAYLLLKDGTAIKTTSYDPEYIDIDINGPKGPNMTGDDMFRVIIKPNNTTGSFDFPYIDKTVTTSSYKSNCKANRGYDAIDSKPTCGTWIYLNHFKIPSDYPWL